MAGTLGMDFTEKLDWNTEPEALGPETAQVSYLTRKGFCRERWRIYTLPCRHLWISPQVNWDGALLGCCDNKAVSLGNVFREGFEECLRSSRYEHVKKVVLGMVEPGPDDPCSQCLFYDKDSHRERIRTLLLDLGSFNSKGGGFSLKR